MDEEIRFQDSKFRRPKFVHPGRRYRQISFDIDANDSDISESCEDEVFVDEPRNADKTSSKPLLQPKNRARSPSFKIKRKCHRLKHCLKLICCVLTAISSCLLVVALVIFALHKSGFSVLAGKVYFGSSESPEPNGDNKTNIIGCTDIQIEDVWTHGFPKMITESAFRLVDVNQDGTLDVLFGFGTGADGIRVPDLVCDIYFNGTRPCFGGVLSIDGKTGTELWRHYTEHEVFALNCNRDVNGDGVRDCLVGGRAGVFRAINGRNGDLLWRFANDEAFNDKMNMYTPFYIRDLNGDDVPEVLLAHGGDPLRDAGRPIRLSGELVILNGKYGDVLRWVKVPDLMETYYSPQLYRQSSDSLAVLFGTGGETHGGALWWIDLDDLLRGRMSKAKKLYSDPYKGIMTPPALVDLNKDGVEDIVLPAFNSTVVTIDGQTLQEMWRASFPGSESYNTPAVGYYNEDDIPDVLVKYAHGPGYPVYYSSDTTILDGKTGKPLLTKPIKDLIGAQSSPLAVSVEGWGNDLFLFWLADCEGSEGQGGEYAYSEDTNVHQKSRADVCRLRFDTRGFNRMVMVGRHLPQAVVTVYDSRQRTDVEHRAWVNTTQEAIEFVKNHQQYLEDYLDYKSHRTSNHYPKNSGRKSVHHDPPSNKAYSQGSHHNTNIGGASRYPHADNGKPHRADHRHYSHPTNRKNGGRYLQNGGNRYADDPRQRSGMKADDIMDKKSYGEFENLLRDYTDGETDSRFGANKQDGRPFLVDNRYGYESDPLGDRAFQNGDRNAVNRLPLAEKNKIFTRPMDSYHKAAYSIPSQRGDIFNSDVDDGRGRYDREKRRRRRKRHVSAHDNNGVQRLLSTGTIAPTLLPQSHPLFNHSIDLIFATYWIFPAKIGAMLPGDKACVRQMMRNATALKNDIHGKYYGLDDHGLLHAVTEECIAQSGRRPLEGTFQDAKEYNPYDLKMGQLTVYRLRLKCTCKDSDVATEGKKCGNVLPYQQQGWAAYMGTMGTSHFNPRKPW